MRINYLFVGDGRPWIVFGFYQRHALRSGEKALSSCKRHQLLGKGKPSCCSGKYFEGEHCAKKRKGVRADLVTVKRRGVTLSLSMAFQTPSFYIQIDDPGNLGGMLISTDLYNLMIPGCSALELDSVVPGEQSNDRRAALQGWHCAPRVRITTARLW